MRVTRTFGETREATIGRVSLVPTMGFLHEGHLSHLRAARDDGDTVLMSLFVNPLQFGPGEDLDRYPRDEDRDLTLAEAAGADVVFAPHVDDMYPAPPLTSVHVAGLTDRLEGLARPGHFDGVTTVVTKLLAGLQPDVARFGRKDAQQLVTIRRMVHDLSLPVRVVAGPTVREPDGLALSSRNVFLAGEDRTAAASLSAGLMAAADLVADGERDGTRLVATVGALLHPGVAVEYIELVAANTATPIDRLDVEAFLAVAARVGSTRLIDNVWLWPDGTADRGVRLPAPSVLDEGRA